MPNSKSWALSHQAAHDQPLTGRKAKSTCRRNELYCHTREYYHPASGSDIFTRYKGLRRVCRGRTRCGESLAPVSPPRGRACAGLRPRTCAHSDEGLCHEPGRAAFRWIRPDSERVQRRDDPEKVSVVEIEARRRDCFRRNERRMLHLIRFAAAPTRETFELVDAGKCDL